jgi:hypothetical protein
MKRTIILSAMLLFAALLNYSSGKSNMLPLTTGEPGPVTTLIIDANVSVMLVNNDKALLKVTGKQSHADLITFSRNGDTLVIGCRKLKMLTGSVVVYVPASQLKKIRINSAAIVRSFNSLRVPKLDVLINGACDIAITNIGELNFVCTESFDLYHNKEVRKIPAGLFFD